MHCCTDQLFLINTELLSKIVFYHLTADSELNFIGREQKFKILGAKMNNIQGIPSGDPERTARDSTDFSEQPPTASKITTNGAIDSLKGGTTSGEILVQRDEPQCATSQKTDVDLGASRTEPCEIHGVLLVGKPGSGKKTLIEHELIPGPIKREFLEQHEPGEWNFSDKRLPITYCIRTIEDLNLMRSFMKSTKQGQQIFNVQHRKNLPEKISLIVFVFQHGRFTREEKAMFEVVLECLSKDAQSICALVITNCESMTVEAKKEVQKEFKNNEDTSNIAKFMGKGIMCLGMPDPSKVKPEFAKKLAEECQASKDELKKLTPCLGGKQLTGDDLFSNVKHAPPCQVM